MRTTFAALAFAAPMLLLASCGTPSEEDLVEDAADRPQAAETAESPIEDGAAFDPDIGRPAFEAAMRVACPTAGIAGAECRATDNPTQFVCEYELIDDTRDEKREVTIKRDGEQWALVETPAHCSTDELENDRTGIDQWPPHPHTTPPLPTSPPGERSPRSSARSST